MGRTTWRQIEQSKRFYVKTFRLSGTLLLFSIGLNMGLLLLINLVYFHQPEPDYYATSGVMPPVQLTGLSEEMAKKSLLADDIPPNNAPKVIPE